MTFETHQRPTVAGKLAKATASGCRVGYVRILPPNHLPPHIHGLMFPAKETTASDLRRYCPDEYSIAQYGSLLYQTLSLRVPQRVTPMLLATKSLKAPTWRSLSRKSAGMPKAKTQTGLGNIVGLAGGDRERRHDPLLKSPDGARS